MAWKKSCSLFMPQVNKMSKFMKYFLLVIAALGVFIVVAVLIITALVDVQSYKPRIEQLVTEQTGYPLHLGGEINLSLFPWVGLGFTNLKMDNPPGFSSSTFVTIESFQARLKLLPLLSRHVEISSFVVKRPEIFLEKNAKGVWNWENLAQSNKPSASVAGKPADAPATGNDNQSPPPSQDSAFTMQSLMVGEFSISNGRVQIHDAAKTLPHQLADFSLQLVDVSLDKPINLNMAAVFDGKPIIIEGVIGPLGQDPGVGKINLDLTVQALDILNMQASGTLEDIKQQKRYNLGITLQPFSPKKLFAALDRPFPFTTADPQVMENLGVRGTIKGDAGQLVVSDGTLLVDDTTITLDMTAKDFSRPNLALNMAVDRIDVDRYLPAGDATDSSTAKEPDPVAAGQIPNAVPSASEKTSPGQTKKNSSMDYAPLRELVLQANVKLAELQVHGGSLGNLAVNVTGQNGIYTMNSLAMELYEGKVDGTGKLNVQKSIPATELNLMLQEVQVGPLLHDFAQKDIIEGKLTAEVAFTMQGDDGASIKKTLTGKGDLRFFDGALLGIDLAQMARTIKAGFSLEQQGERPKTDFAELHAPFTITNGLVNTQQTTLRSPFIRVSAQGDADLVSETLDMKIKPTIVGTIKGQGDEEQRAGLSAPILVSGTFSSPQFSPDLESLVKDQMPTEQEIKEIIQTGKIPPQRKERFKEDVEQAKELFKGLFGK